MCNQWLWFSGALWSNELLNVCVWICRSGARLCLHVTLHQQQREGWLETKNQKQEKLQQQVLLPPSSYMADLFMCGVFFTLRIPIQPLPRIVIRTSLERVVCVPWAISKLVDMHPCACVTQTHPLIHLCADAVRTRRPTFSMERDVHSLSRSIPSLWLSPPTSHSHNLLTRYSTPHISSASSG